MNKPFVIIEYVITETLKQILYNFVEWYENPAKLTGICIYRCKGNNESFLLTFDNNPVDLDMFSFLVYYLSFPMKIENHNPVVYGFYKAPDIKEAYIMGEWIMVYINTEDPAPDKSYFTTEDGTHYINNYANGIRRIASPGKPYNFIKANIDDYNHIITIVTIY